MKHRVIDTIIAREGGYVDDPEDSGGETNFGITVAVARENGFTGAMRDMTRQVAFDIYAARYWDAVNADAVAAMSEAIAEELVDTGVNQGPARAGNYLQRSLNVLNRSEKLYADIVVDGDIGPASLRALDAYLGSRGETVLLRALNCLQGAGYIELAERREKDERFVYGWLANRVVI